MHCYFDTNLRLGPDPHRFIALDKVVPKAHFLDVVQFPDKTGATSLSYDTEWLAILRATQSFFPRSSVFVSMQKEYACVVQLIFI